MHSITSQAPDKIGEILSPQTVPAHGGRQDCMAGPYLLQNHQGERESYPGDRTGSIMDAGLLANQINPGTSDLCHLKDP